MRSRAFGRGINLNKKGEMDVDAHKYIGEWQETSSSLLTIFIFSYIGGEMRSIKNE